MTLIDTVRLIVLVLHFIGLAAIVGPFILQVSRRGTLELRTMLIGSIVQLATGVALVALRSAGGLVIDPAKFAVKFGVAVVVLAAMIGAVAGARRGRAGEGSPRATGVLFRVAGILAVGDIAVAVLWQ